MYGVIRDVKGVRVGIGGFNTAWSSYLNYKKGNLWIGTRWQYNTIRSKLKDADIKIVLLHHPPNWFVEKEDSNFEISLQETFTFCLHGHEHEKVWVKHLDNGHTTISAGACYQSSEKINGYNIVRLNLDTKQGEVWLRTYDNTGAGGWKQNVIRNKTNAYGVWRLNHTEWMNRICTQP